MISEEKKAEVVAYLTAQGMLNPGFFQVSDDDGIYGVIVNSDGRADIFEPHPMPTPKAFPEPVSEIENGAFTTVAGMLDWAADRMVDVYDEDDRIEFVLAFRREAERLRDHMDGLPLSEISGSDKGLSAFDVAKLNGFAGTCQEWLLTLTGPSGASEPRPATETVRVSDDEIDTLVQGIVEAGKTALGPDGYVALLEELADEEDPAGWIDAEARQLYPSRSAVTSAGPMSKISGSMKQSDAARPRMLPNSSGSVHRWRHCRIGGTSATLHSSVSRSAPPSRSRFSARSPESPSRPVSAPGAVRRSARRVGTWPSLGSSKRS